RRLNGECFPADLTVTVISLEDGRHLMQTLIEDATERKRAEEAIRSRARRDELVSRLSREFVQEGASVAVPRAIHALGEFLGAARSFARVIKGEGNDVQTLGEWCAPGVPFPDPARRLPTRQTTLHMLEVL